MRLVAVLIFLISLPAAANISRLSWLTGCWAYDGEDAGSGEYWMPPAGGTMLAISRTVRDSACLVSQTMKLFSRIQHTISRNVSSTAWATAARYSVALKANPMAATKSLISR